MAEELDPQRYPFKRLADLSHKLPVPGTARLFSQEEAGERVDSHDPFWALCIADGSLVDVEGGAPNDPPADPRMPALPPPAA